MDVSNQANGYLQNTSAKSNSTAIISACCILAVLVTFLILLFMVFDPVENTAHVVVKQNAGAQNGKFAQEPQLPATTTLSDISYTSATAPSSPLPASNLFNAH